MQKWHLHIPERHELDDPDSFNLDEMKEWSRQSWTFWVNGCVHMKFNKEREAHQYFQQQIGKWDCEIALLDPQLRIASIDNSKHKFVPYLITHNNKEG